MTGLEKALALAAIGCSVLPCHEDGPKRKAPYLKHGLLDASTDADVITRWWKKHPDALVGVVAGPSRLLCLDIDVDAAKGVDGWQSLDAEGHLPLPDTLHYKTARGGTHYVYRAPAGVELDGQSDHLGMAGIDRRGGSSYFIWWAEDVPATRKAFRKAAPAWLAEASVAKSSDRAPYAGSVKEWRDTTGAGKPKRAIKAALAKVPTESFDRNALRDRIVEVVSLGAEGHPGASRAINIIAEAYLSGQWDTREYAAKFDRVVADAIADKGARRGLGTLPLPKKPKKAKKRAEAAPSMYVDIAQVLAGPMTPPAPDAGAIRADGERMIYRGKVNGLVGEPETGKTLIATANAVDELSRGGSVLWIDVDHNGAAATVGRFVSSNVDRSVLLDPARFRLVTPEDSAAVEAVIVDAAAWSPSLVVVDSVGEILPMFGADSNSADDYSGVHRAVFAPLAAVGAAVLLLDHLAKTASGSGYASGTGAKKRAMDGAYYGVKVVEAFRPGAGGAAALTILKDRHGGVRATSASDTAAVFRLDSRHGDWTWEFHPGRSDEARLTDDVEALIALDPRPTSRSQVQEAMRDPKTGRSWGNDRAAAALRGLRDHTPTSSLTPFEEHPTTNEGATSS